jgi:serine/threonine protein kinase
MGELDPRIRIRAPLRCDGIGRLDCAEDTETGVRLAVRWLPLDANGNAAVRACELLPPHPTLPRIRQTGTVGAAAFVAMDFPEGQLLSTRLGERMDVDFVIHIGAQIADALTTVHAQNVVHGEMSSDSFLLVPPDRAYLWDLPLVIANRLTDRRGENRLMYNLVKTSPFLSPERARGEGASQPGDVYALGAILCVAAGAPLPTASTTLGVVHQVAAGEWVPRVPTVLPEPWRSMLGRMIARDPAVRPTAKEVAATFSFNPAATAFPTVPDLPAVRLPPEIATVASAKKVSPEEPSTSEPAENEWDSRPPPPVMAEEVLQAPDARSDAAILVASSDYELVTSGETHITAEIPLKTSIQLTDSVSVAPDLVDAGARLLPNAANRRPASQSLVLIGVAVAILVAGLVMLVVSLKIRKPSTSIERHSVKSSILVMEQSVSDETANPEVAPARPAPASVDDRRRRPAAKSAPEPATVSSLDEDLAPDFGIDDLKRPEL